MQRLQCPICNGIPKILVRNVEDIVVFSTRNVFISEVLNCFSKTRNAQVTFAKEFGNENKHKNFDIYIIHTLSDKAFKGTVVNPALSLLHEG